MTKKLSNLEKIKRAWAIGWSATLEDTHGIFHVIGVNNERVGVVEDGKADTWRIDAPKGFKITGYLYAGELGGNEPIPEGQKFRVKGMKLVGEYKGMDNGRVVVGRQSYDKSEIEPYWE